MTTILHHAILDSRLHQVRLLVDSLNVNVEKRDQNWYTPIMLTCVLENQEYGLRMMKILMKAGADANVYDRAGRSALSLACIHGREEIVKYLLDEEDAVEYNLGDLNGDTPLHHCAANGRSSIAKILIKKLKFFGLSLDERNQPGYTPLLLATKLGHYQTAKCLVENGASVHIRDNQHFKNVSDWIEYNVRATRIPAHYLDNRSVIQPTPLAVSFPPRTSQTTRTGQARRSRQLARVPDTRPTRPFTQPSPVAAANISFPSIAPLKDAYFVSSEAAHLHSRFKGGGIAALRSNQSDLNALVEALEDRKRGVNTAVMSRTLASSTGSKYRPPSTSVASSAPTPYSAIFEVTPSRIQLGVGRRQRPRRSRTMMDDLRKLYRLYQEQMTCTPVEDVNSESGIVVTSEVSAK